MHPLAAGRLAAFEAMGGATAEKADAGMGGSVGKMTRRKKGGATAEEGNGKPSANAHGGQDRLDRVPAGGVAKAGQAKL